MVIHEIVQLQSALHDDYINVSGKIKHVPYIRYPARPRRIIVKYIYIKECNLHALPRITLSIVKSIYIFAFLKQ